MRTLLLALLMSVMLAPCTLAQEEQSLPENAASRPLPIRFLLAGGLGYGQLFVPQAKDETTPFVRSWSVRAGLEIPFTSSLGLRTEVAYSDGGGMVENPLDVPYTHREEYRFREIRVPVLLQVGTDSRANTRGYLAFGGFGGYIVNHAQRELLLSGTDGGSVMETGWMPVYGIVPVYAGATIEVGVRTRVLGLELGCDVRFNHGLTSLGSGSRDVLSRDLLMSFGISIP